MKNTKTFFSAITGLLVLQLALVACSKPKERAETIDVEIQPNLVEISALHDISSETTMAYFYKDSSNREVSLADPTKQIKTNPTVHRVLSMIKNPESQKALIAQMMPSGLIAFAVMADEVKIYKVMTKAHASSDEKTNSALGLSDIKKIKKLSLEKNALTVAATHVDLTESKNEIQYIEIAAIKIAKSGVLENKRTKYYDEKTSILTVGERPLDVSTHLLLEPQEEPKKATEPTAP